MAKLTPTLWIAGCSFAHGHALDNMDHRYGQLIANHYNIEAKFLTEPGSSIGWAHDQIIHSDIKPNDIVIWGVTSLERFSFFNPVEQFVNAMNITQNRFQEYNDALKLLFTSNHYTVTNINLIKQIQVLLDRNGTKLILCFHPELSLPEHGEMFLKEFSTNEHVLIPSNNSLTWDGQWPSANRRYLDFGSDGNHPGPDTHKAWADQIIKVIKERNLV